jgi:flagellar P-ring protein precursor FlgI
MLSLQPMRSLRGLALLLVVVCFGGLTPHHARASRVQELVDIRGVRDNQLVGYGLVVGLNNTGDTGQSRFTVQSTAAMLRRLGATVDPSSIQTKNAAAVMVTATLGHDADAGTRIDVTVSSLGNARSLLGGTLLQTPLYGADREVYAVAQGAVVIGGYSAGGSSGSSVSLNHVTAGRVPAGAIVEREVHMTGLDGPNIELSLRMPSFVTATRIVNAVNSHFDDEVALALDAGTVRLRVPQRFRGDPVRLLAEIELLDVEPDAPARVVIDERTGTVVLGTNVSIGEVAIAQGGLSIEITETPAVSQPNALAGGETVVVPQTDVRAEVRGGPMAHVPASATLADVVSALNALGAGPRALISIFQALRTAGALHAEIRLQ